VVLIVEFLLLVGLANATPVLARKVFKQHFAWPLDGGLRFIDGQPLLGPSKTLRGVVCSVLMTALGAELLGLGWQTGALTSVLAMAGDLFSSFIKRRMKLPSSSKVTGLDQVPESLFPALAGQPRLGFSYTDVLIIVVLFFVFERILSPLFYRLEVRRRPH
jgi:CDP-2,3-bis-(O-geranylgeranyl)-sn-glycerol synthase